MTREEINEKKQKDIFLEHKKEISKKIIKVTIKTILIITIICTLFFSYTTYISTTKTSVREYRIINKKIPNNFNGLKIIQFSDLHYGSTIYKENLSSIKRIINERKPDIIIFTGDLIDNKYKMTKKDNDILTNTLKQLKSTLGKYSIIGDEDKDDISTIYNQADFTILKNEYDLIYNDNKNPILLIGLSSLISNQQDINKGFNYFNQESYNSDIYTITLVHEPDSTDDIINNYNTDIIMSGHSHNGDIRLPIIRYPLFKYNGAKKYNQDYYKIKNTELFISGGLGTNNKTGIRLFCRPSINLYRLSNK